MDRKFENNTKVRHKTGFEVTVKGYFHSDGELYYICSFDNEKNKPKIYQYDCLIIPGDELRLNSDIGPCVVDGRFQSNKLVLEWGYGLCPICKSPSVGRERRPNGNDICTNGHTFPSSKVIARTENVK
jgi:hypothetical protein